MTEDRDFTALVDGLARDFAMHTAEHDAEDRFVADEYRVLREQRVFSAAVPRELGGRGISHGQMCRALRSLGRSSSSTALCLSMHQHLVAAQVWNYRHGKPGQKMLEKVAAEELVLVSTGASDWLSSNGRMEKVDGGFHVTARKVFASGSPAGALLVTSAPYEDPVAGWQVLHFPVALSAKGVQIEDDWRAHGMRGTGSNTINLNGVFVPEESISLRRPRGQFHPAWSVILTVALPLIVSVYVGVAESAAAIARERARHKAEDPTLLQIIGEMENALASAQMAVDSMVANANDCEFEAVIENANAALVRKTIAVRACVEVTEKAMEATGGPGFFRGVGLERLLRDVRAGQFHPLPEKKQQQFTGRLALGLDPVRDAG